MTDAERYLTSRGTSPAEMILGDDPVDITDERWYAVMGWADQQVEEMLAAARRRR